MCSDYSKTRLVLPLLRLLGRLHDLLRLLRRLHELRRLLRRLHELLRLKHLNQESDGRALSRSSH